MTRWLTAEQQKNWRAWLSASQLLNDQLSRELQDKHGMTIADYEILVRLSEAPERRLRMSELAEQTLSSRSRLSHQIDRMEKAGNLDELLKVRGWGGAVWQGRGGCHEPF